MIACERKVPLIQSLVIRSRSKPPYQAIFRSFASASRALSPCARARAHTHTHTHPHVYLSFSARPGDRYSVSVIRFANRRMSRWSIEAIEHAHFRFFFAISSSSGGADESTDEVDARRDIKSDLVHRLRSNEFSRRRERERAAFPPRYAARIHSQPGSKSIYICIYVYTREYFIFTNNVVC